MLNIALYKIENKENSMKLQNWEVKRAEITKKFKDKINGCPGIKKKTLKLSWSNWGFGIETLEDSAKRLNKFGVEWIELHGNRYGKDLGYNSRQVLKTLKPYGIKVAGICGMFGPQNDFSSNSGTIRQNAIDYSRRQIELCVETGGTYILIVPAAVGRPTPYDGSEFHRSVETLKIIADEFAKAGIRGAVEPIRSAEVSIVHTFKEAEKYIEMVDSKGVQHINGDVYHMQSEESNIAETIVKYGSRLINLHLADSNRCALGDGSMDIDAIIMALYLIDYHEGMKFATPEPLGPGGDPYPAMFGSPSPDALDKLVGKSIRYFREREKALLQ